jgi:hypothetical protein
MIQYQDFWKAAQQKMEQKTEEEGRPLDPWNHNNEEFFQRRLKEEWKELWKDGEFHPEELVDVANFCAYIWLKKQSDEWKKDPKNHPYMYDPYDGLCRICDFGPEEHATLEELKVK